MTEDLHKALMKRSKLRNKFLKQIRQRGLKQFQTTMNCAEFFNNFFSKTVNELKVRNISNYKLDNNNDPLKEALRYFKNHPSITNTK